TSRCRQYWTPIFFSLVYMICIPINIIAIATIWKTLIASFRNTPTNTHPKTADSDKNGRCLYNSDSLYVV
ncbi:MAG: hypothetical protein WB664_04665, partial [Nitrososphaeraceae archaeon]